MTEKDLEIIKIAKEVEIKGFESVTKKYNYSRKKLLNILYMAVNINIINKQQKEIFLRILKEQLFQYKLTDKKVGCLADVHIWNKNSYFEYVKMACEEFGKQGIESIFLLGDILDGYGENFNIEKKTQRYLCEKQLEYLQKEYPKNFKNYYVFGNHEEQFKWLGINLECKLSTMRDDIFPLGIGFGYVEWDNKKIALGHKTTINKNPIFLKDCDYYIYGHSHFYDYNQKYNTLKVPTCSNVYPNNQKDKKYQPGFIILETKKEKLISHRYIFDGYKPVHAFKRVLKLSTDEKMDA